MKSLFLLLFSFLATACTGTYKNSIGILNIAPHGGLFGGGVHTRNDQNPLGDEILGVELDNTDFDIPITKNKHVEFWVRYFTGKGRKVFSRYLERYGHMGPLIYPKLEKAGLPKDLIFMAMIESGFNHRARSSANAVGTWQFISGTGRRYGLSKNWWYDERRDPTKSTDSAIRYLSYLYNKFDSWEIAMASYNGGEGRLMKGIRRYNTKNFWVLSKKRAIRKETRNYVPKIMAAAIVTKNAEAFGFKKPSYAPTWTQTKLVPLRSPESIETIAKVCSIPKKEMYALNPELLLGITPPRKNYNVRVPHEKAYQCLLSAQKNKTLGTYKEFVRYRIRRGDNLSQIARRFRVGVRHIMAFNNMSNAHRIRPGRSLILPIAKGTKIFKKRKQVRRQVTKRKKAKRGLASLGKKFIVHVIKKGDTLYELSRRYSVTVRQLKRWNGIHRHRLLQLGSTLRVY